MLHKGPKQSDFTLLVGTCSGPDDLHESSAMKLQFSVRLAQVRLCLLWMSWTVCAHDCYAGWNWGRGTSFMMSLKSNMQQEQPTGALAIGKELIVCS